MTHPDRILLYFPVSEKDDNQFAIEFQSMMKERERLSNPHRLNTTGLQFLRQANGRWFSGSAALLQSPEGPDVRHGAKGRCVRSPRRSCI
jgi:hypothetical protein